MGGVDGGPESQSGVYRGAWAGEFDAALWAVRYPGEATWADRQVDSRGISLRFPRFIQVRDDKNADEATTAEQVSEFYQRQATAGGGKKAAASAGDDFW